LEERAGESDHFLSVLSPSGTALEWSTFLGGSGSEYGAVDIGLHGGRIALRGGRITYGATTDSADYPVSTNAFDTLFSKEDCLFPWGEGVVGALDKSALTMTPPSVELEAAAYSAAESQGGVTVAVRRTGFGGNAASVELATIADTAIANVDFTPVTTRINFAPNQTRATVTIPLRSDGPSNRASASTSSFGVRLARASV